MDSRYQPGMGITDPSTSSTELSFDNIERLINSLLNDCPTEGSNVFLPRAESVPVPNFLLQDRFDYFIQVAGSIMRAKCDFLERYASVNKEIESMVQKIMQLLNYRETSLKKELEYVKSQKFRKWNKQLLICGTALEQLRLCEIGYADDADRVYKNFARELGFIDAGEATFSDEYSAKIIKYFPNLGSIRYREESMLGRLRPSSLKAFVPKFTFGSSGTEPGQFCRSWGICSDAMGRILVCDRNNHRVQVFNESGSILIQFGSQGSRPGQFNRPTGIDIDKKNRIVVSDKDNHRIQVFSFSGIYLHGFGSQGTKAGQFMYPWDVAVNSDCDIAVSDSKNNRVQLFSENGDLISIFGSNETCRSRRPNRHVLDSPRGLAFGPNDMLLVTDFNNHRVLLLNKRLLLIEVFGCEGHTPGKFFRPQGIACDKESGVFAVADSKNYRIQMFDLNLRLLHLFGSQGEEPGQFDCPQGISFHCNRNILVVDLNNNRVQIF